MPSSPDARTRPRTTCGLSPNPSWPTGSSSRPSSRETPAREPASSTTRWPRWDTAAPYDRFEGRAERNGIDVDTAMEPTSPEPRARPGILLLAATLLPAAYLWMEIGRAVPARLDYPSLSHHAPVQLLFLYGEHLRLSCADQPPSKAQEAKQRVTDSIAELNEELARYGLIAPRGGAARERRVLRDSGALTVVAAGWSDASARHRLEHGSPQDVPDYA